MPSHSGGGERATAPTRFSGASRRRRRNCRFGSVTYLQHVRPLPRYNAVWRFAHQTSAPICDRSICAAPALYGGGLTHESAGRTGMHRAYAVGLRPDREPHLGRDVFVFPTEGWALSRAA